MKRSSLGFFSVLALIAFSSASSFAAVRYGSDQRGEIRSGLVQVFQEYHQLHMDLEDAFLQKVAKRGLDLMVAQGCDLLREVGEFDLADQYQTQWTQQVSLSLNEGNVSALELGDFAPLSPWLDNFYNTLYRKTRGIVRGIRVIHDIYQMNYALAVVFKPNGNWRSHTAYDRIEYRKHFIPFVDATTYWVSLKACEKYLPQYKKICGNAAPILEKYMGRYVAPILSDRVFALATHGHSTELQTESVVDELSSTAGNEIDFESFASQSIDGSAISEE